MNIVKAAPALALMMAACSQPEVSACEAFVKDNLSSPKSYLRVNIMSKDQSMTLAQFREITGDKPGGSLEQLNDESHEHGIRSVRLDYDAQNGFGATVRETRQCLFRLRDGKLLGDATTFAQNAKTRADNREFRDLMRSGSLSSVNPADVPPDPAPSCCL